MKPRTKFVPVNSMDMATEGILETSGLITCVSCVGYFKKGEKRYGFLSHYPAVNPTEYLSEILTFIQKHPELNGYNEGWILIFRLADEEIYDGLNCYQQDGTIQTYKQSIEQILLGLCHQFPNTRIEERSYKSIGNGSIGGVKLDVSNSSWKSNIESGKFE